MGNPPQRQNEKEISLIAEELYNYYKGHANIQIEDWLESLLLELSKSLQMDREDIEFLLEDIIRFDKNISPELLTEESKRELFREISEWLVAEGILNMVKKYKAGIDKGINEGILVRIDDIVKISVIKVLENVPRFANIDELRTYIRDNYIIDTGSLIGSGKRMNVYDFIPLEYPLPFPKEDGLTKAIVFKYPNKFLVIRIMNNIYRNFLSDRLEESEDASINDFNTINPFFTYSNPELNIDQTHFPVSNQVFAKSMIKRGRLLKTHLTGRSMQRRSFSFIPPLIIMKVKLQNSQTEEYVTIQQKILKRGELSIFDPQFVLDIAHFNSFRRKVRSFIRAFKRLFLIKGLMPDLIGSGNVLYNERMNIYLVDINNVSKEPDFISLSNMLLLRDIKIALMEALGISILEKIKTAELCNIAKQACRGIFLLDEFFRTFYEINKKLNITIENFERIIDFENYNDKNLLSFLRMIRFIDDLHEPIFLHNIDKVYQIERFIYLHEKKADMDIIESRLRSDPFYKILFWNHGAWKSKSIFELKDMLTNKHEGLKNWISYYSMGFYNSFVSARHTGGL